MPDTKAPNTLSRPAANEPAQNEPIDVARQLRRAMGAVTDMRGKLAAAEARNHEPVAIIGMACRFPGAPDLDSYWQLLTEGRDAVREVPASRWDIDALYDPDPDAPGKMSTRWGGFIDEVECFDATLFGISPREALVLDPQQRLLLETAWRALEDAGIAPDSLSGSATGVYVGLSTTDYARLLTVRLGERHWIDGHASLGNSVAVAAGRLSYSLGLQGPSLVVDTACSSSLVAVHLAAQGLRRNETRMALVGGVNLMLSPELNIGFSKARMMAADGRCKTLDAAADGYVRGEGCGVIALKRLSDALADGDRIHALILGSGVNQDGRSNGLTAPNGPAQTAVIRAALADARLGPEQVTVIEAHGTGTPLGDPIEVRALAAVYGARPDGAEPAWLGSVKTNIGHLEAAAGMAGLIKAALAAERGVIPAHLHFRTLNPHIAADGFPFAVPTHARPWAGVDGRRIAGVSSFGFSGTNGHVIVASPPPTNRPACARVPVLALSAADGPGLEALRKSALGALAALPADDPQALVDLAATLGAGRARHGHRVAVAVTDPASAATALAGQQVVSATAAPSVAFLFTGQGCQYPGMAAGLLQDEPVFRAMIQRCDEALGDRLGVSLIRLLQDSAAPLTCTDRLQPVLFAVELATAALWQSWGVEAGAVIGHSVGEIAAACHAGVFSPEDGIRFIAERGRLMESRAGLGGMAAVLADAGRVEQLIHGTGAVIAGLNAPQSTVIAGDSLALNLASERLVAAGLAVQALDVATAFHSAVLDPCLDGIAAAAAAMTHHTAKLPVAANLTGTLTRRFDAAYWRAQARGPVRFIDGLRALADSGCRVMLEVGPQPVLSGLGRACLRDVVADARFIPSLKRGNPDRAMIADAAASLFAAGVAVDWDRYHSAADGSRGWRPVAAPLYPFRRDRFWPDPAEGTGAGLSIPMAAGAGQALPLLGQAVDTPLDVRIHQADLSVTAMPFLADHVVFGDIVVPGAMHATLGLMLAGQAGHSPAAVGDLVFAQALVAPPADGGDAARAVMQTVAQPDGSFSVHSRRSGQDGWTVHASGRLLAADAAVPAPLDLPALQAGLTPDQAGPDALFDMLAAMGIVLGPAFRGLHRLWRGDGQALAEIHRPDGLGADAEDLPIHPAVLDSCFQLLGATFSGEGTSGGFLPLSIDRISLWQRPGARFFCHARIADAGPSTEIAVGHFRLCDGQGRVLMAIDGLQIKRVAAPVPADPVSDALLAVDWQEVAGTIVPAAAGWADVAGAADAARRTAHAAALPETGLADGLDRLAARYARDALSALDLIALPDLSREKARLLARLHHIADDSGGGDVAARQLTEAFPGNAADIALVARCGRAIADVLTDKADPLSLLFTDEAKRDEAGGEGVYARAGLAETANDMAAAALSAALAQRGDGATRPRLLEVGAGTGATTAALLPVLEQAGGAGLYHFTDLSVGFLTKAGQRFAGVPDFATGQLDLEKPVTDPQRYDVVIAANVVHATADLRQSLGNIRQMLAPGGLLILVESTIAQLWWDIVFGLTDGWWRFADSAVRPDHALISADRWCDLLHGTGFAEASAIAVDGPGRQSVILARADGGADLLLTGQPSDQALAVEVIDRLGACGQPARWLPLDGALARIADPAPLAGVALMAGNGLAGNGSAENGLADSGLGDHADLRAAFDLSRAMITANRSGLCLVTRGAVALSVGPVNPLLASLWGFGRVVALEHPELACRRIDIGAGGTAATLAHALLADPGAGEAEVAWADNRLLVSRLIPAPLPAVPSDFAVSANGTHLIVGGFGGLGLPLARWLISRGARTLLLAGRRAPDADLAASIAALSVDGVRVIARVADVADEVAMTALFADIDASLPPLKGVYHLAGSVADGALITQTWDRFASVLPAKADAALLLDRLTRNRVLDQFVLFSTSAALIGNRGQSNHAAANAVLDALAEERRASGLPGLSINWGAWAGAGAVEEGRHAAAMIGRGARPFTLDQGLDGLGRALAATGTPEGRGRYGFVSVDWRDFLSGYGDRIPPYLAHVAPKDLPVAGSASRAGRSGPAVAVRDFRALLTAERPELRRAVLADLLRAEAAEVLGLDDPARIDSGQALNEIGLDSLLALELRNRLGAALGTAQPATLLFNYPSIAALADYVGQHFADLLVADPVAATGNAADGEAAEQDLMAEVLAMSDDDIEAFLDQELQGLASITAGD